MLLTGSADCIRVWQRIKIGKQIEPSREIFWGICNWEKKKLEVMHFIFKEALQCIQQFGLSIWWISFFKERGNDSYFYYWKYINYVLDKKWTIFFLIFFFNTGSLHVYTILSRTHYKRLWSFTFHCRFGRDLTRYRWAFRDILWNGCCPTWNTDDIKENLQ